MTIDGWFLFGILAILFIGGGGAIAFLSEESGWKVCGIGGGLILTFLLYIGMAWYFNNTASGQRALTDQRSDFGNGLERDIIVYTADGHIIREFHGKIDIEGNDGGYVLFDFEGKRYSYYNCFVESIAEIGR